MLVVVVSRETLKGVNSMDKAKLLDLMAEKGLTQAGLAEKAGVSRTAVWGMMKKGRTPTIVTFGKIARVLGVRASELMDM